MKNILLAAAAFVAITCPAFAMEADSEKKTRTITVVADLNARNSLKLAQGGKKYHNAGLFCDCAPDTCLRTIYANSFQAYPNRCNLYDVKTKGSFSMAPSGYKYDYDKHAISFSIRTNDSNPITKEFKTSYCVDKNGYFQKEAFYDHSFRYEIPAGIEDITVQATLLSIYSKLPSNAGYGHLEKTITFDK